MARIVVFRGKGPIAVGDPPVSVCGCGLSKTFPYCSGAHIRVQDEEDSIYVYDTRGRRLGRAEAVETDRGPVGVSDVYSPA